MPAQDYEQVTYNSPDGAQVGQSSTEKIGFWGATPVVQPAAATQAALTETTAGVAASCVGFQSATAFCAMISLVGAMRTALVNSGIMKGCA
jgi:hypothetical protein